MENSGYEIIKTVQVIRTEGQDTRDCLTDRENYHPRRENYFDELLPRRQRERPVCDVSILHFPGVGTLANCVAAIHEGDVTEECKTSAGVCLKRHSLTLPQGELLGLLNPSEMNGLFAEAMFFLTETGRREDPLAAICYARRKIKKEPWAVSLWPIYSPLPTRNCFFFLSNFIPPDRCSGR